MSKERLENINKMRSATYKAVDRLVL